MTASLTPVQREELTLLMTPKWNDLMPYPPTVKQHAGLLLDDYKELLYGGAAGGGKTDFLLMAALQYADVPGYKALILRRTYPQLSTASGLMQRAQEWLHEKARGLNVVGGYPTRWVFPSGATLDFGHCQHEKNRYDYQGAEYQFIGFDELTQFSSRIYLYLFSRLRRLENHAVPIRCRSTSNPGGEGHDWVYERFPIPRPDLAWEFTDDVRKRVFIPSYLDDNPHLDREEYRDTLSELHPFDRLQLLDGDWTARPPGGLFKREWFKIVDTVPSQVQKVRRWDLAATEQSVASSDPDWTVGVGMGRYVNGAIKYVVTDVQRFRENHGPTEQRIRQTAELDGRGTQVRMEQEPGASGKIVIAHYAKVLDGYAFKGVPSTGDKFVRSAPFAAACERGDVSLLRAPWNEAYLRELEQFGCTEGASHDDQADASSGAHTDLSYQRGLSPADLYGAPAEGAQA